MVDFSPLYALIGLLPLDCLQPRFMQQALLGLLLLTPMAAVLGVQVINFRMAFFSDAIGHSAFAGVALGLILSVNPRLSMPLFGVLVGLAVMAVRRKSNLSADTAIGIVFSAVVAFGLAVVSRAGGVARDMQQFLYGDILTISEGEIAFLALLFPAILLFQAVGYNRLLAIALNPVMARVHGVRVALWQYVFAGLLEIDDLGFKYYFQFTLNNYEPERLEPGLPPLEQRLETFCRLSEQLGRERVIWRWDPLLLAAALPTEALLERLDAVGRRLSPLTDKLVISFLDIYEKIRGRLAAHAAAPRAPLETETSALARGLARCNAAWPHPLRLGTCAEAADLSAWGIAHNACADPALISRLCPEDADVQRLCGLDPAQARLLPAAPRKAAKDPSRRKHCQCLPAKDIGAYSTCPHACVYCYANQSQNVVRARLRARKPGTESLI